MKDFYIVSDVHGNLDALMDALFRAELFDNHGAKKDNAYIVQIGDLANCVRDSIGNDLDCLNTVGDEIDLMLIGNHEIPYFDGQNTFSGFHWYDEIYQRLVELRYKGLLQPSLHHGNTLITHAGVTTQHMPPTSRYNEDGMETAWDMQRKIEHEWGTANYPHSLFSDIGQSRNGKAHQGGILWCDFDYEFEPTNFPQIVGHTPGVLRQKGNALCIDTIRSTGLPTVLKLEG